MVVEQKNRRSSRLVLIELDVRIAGQIPAVGPVDVLQLGRIAFEYSSGRTRDRSSFGYQRPDKSNEARICERDSSRDGFPGGLRRVLRLTKARIEPVMSKSRFKSPSSVWSVLNSASALVSPEIAY